MTQEFLPRVIIETSNGIGSIKVNFRMSSLGTDEVPSGVKSIFAIMDDWTSYCIASIEHMPYMSSVGYYITDRQIREEIVDFLKGTAVSYEQQEVGSPDDPVERNSFIIHEEDVSFVAAKLSTTTHLLKAASAIQRSNLGALIAEFDYLMFRLLRALFKDSPGLLISDEETINIGFLRSGRSFEEWQSENIEKKISQKLRESHDEVIKWILSDIAGVADISSVAKSPFYIDFLEVCQRRHIFIHNGGVVNKDYLQKCLAAGRKADSLPKEGDQLHVDAEYIKSAAARVYLVGAFVLSIAVQRLYPAHANLSHRSLLAASHDFLQVGMTKMCERIINFAENQSKHFDNDMRLKFAINKALAKLYEPGVDPKEQSIRAEKVLQRYDWSVTTPVFDLALACVRRDFSDIINLAKRAHASGLGYQDASHFCVFREAREFPGFMECFPRGPLMLKLDEN